MVDGTAASVLQDLLADPFWQLIDTGPFAEPMLPIAERNNDVTLPDLCANSCAYGTCGSSGYQACGGCCGCRGGCVVQWENQQMAPFVWNGDQA